VLVADSGEGGQLADNAENSGSYVGAARPITKVFAELFFSSVRGSRTGLDGYVRNGGTPKSLELRLSYDVKGCRARGFLRLERRSDLI